MATKVLKARCKVTGVYIAVQVRKEGDIGYIVGCYPVDAKTGANDLQSTVYCKQYKVDTKLKACSVCGSQKAFGCSCAASKNSCNGKKISRGLDCLFCSNLEPDYTRVKSTNRQYNINAGKSNIIGMARDRFGNAQGSEGDLARDGAFRGKTIAVLQFYTGEGFDFVAPTTALEKKGFAIRRLTEPPTSEASFRQFLADTCQLWVISDRSRHLNEMHKQVIKEYFESGRGLYVWGDNQPFYEDANFIGSLFGTVMSGNYTGDKVVGLKTSSSSYGIVEDHLITTGLVNFYEGITVASIKCNDLLKPLIYGSDGIVLAAYSEANGRRLILDGGFTRLFIKWTQAGTDRYVKNAAAWLANSERFWYEYEE